MSGPFKYSAPLLSIIEVPTGFSNASKSQLHKTDKDFLIYDRFLFTRQTSDFE